MRFAFLLLSLLTISPLFARTSEVIITGAFYTAEHAQQRIDKLKMYLSYEEEAYALQKEGHFTYEVRASGAYYLCVLHHFRNFGEVLTVIDSIKKIYPDVYIENNMDFTHPIGFKETAIAIAKVPAAVLSSTLSEEARAADQGGSTPINAESMPVNVESTPLANTLPAPPAQEKSAAANSRSRPRSEPGASPLPLLWIAAALPAAATILLSGLRHTEAEKIPLTIPKNTEQRV